MFHFKGISQYLRHLHLLVIEREAFTLSHAMVSYPIIITFALHFLLSVNTAQKATIQWATTMLTTSENVLFPGHNNLLTTSTDDLTLYRQQGYDLEIALFRSG